MTDITLYQFAFSHYNEKARWALDYKDISHNRRSYMPVFHMIPAMALSGQRYVPFLHDGGDKVSGSHPIIEHLETKHGGSPLIPTSDPERREALELCDLFDDAIGPHLRRVAYYHFLPHERFITDVFTLDQPTWKRPVCRAFISPIRFLMRKSMRIDEAGAERSRAKLEGALDKLDALLTARPAARYLVGDRFTVADLTAAALLSPMIRPPELQYTLPPSPCAAWDAYAAGFEARPFWGWVLEIYRAHRGRRAKL